MTTGSKALLILVAMGIDSPTVAIAPTPINIDFSAPAGCSTLDSFYRGVRSRTERVRLANPAEPGVQIRVRVFRAGSNIRGELRIGDQQEESETRRVDGISCNEVVEALSLTAALALDPSASLLSERNPIPEQSTSPSPATSTPALGPSASATTKLPPPITSRKEGATPEVPANSGRERGNVTEVDLSAAAIAATYTRPGLMLGPQIGLRFTLPTRHWTHLTASVQAFYLSNDLLGAAEMSIFQITGMGLSMCPLYGTLVDWLELGTCAIARGAWLRARGLGLTHPQTVVRSWWAVGVESLASLRLQDHWGLELSAGLVAPLIIREFHIGTPSQALDVGKTPIIGAQTGVGVAYRF